MSLFNPFGDWPQFDGNGASWGYMAKQKRQEPQDVLDTIKQANVDAVRRARIRQLYAELRSLPLDNWNHSTRVKANGILRELQELEGEDY